MEEKDFMQMCLDVYRYCALYCKQSADEIDDFIYFFVMERLVMQRLKEENAAETDWVRVQGQFQAEQERWLEYHREEVARGKAAMRFLREMIQLYREYFDGEK